ncbi:TetR/AcrR family transcriptional regulator [Microbacterium binotii]|uniref:TetR/AcrR family transcriptional regulator n=1 Tax=Microbacterium binotii TaxID=462710 RepID=UPI001F40113C|nr:TetR/AcrR family transcriptional regulator [Microbacterium binotii]UIN31514.1 TetR/AcrR family transcriptional regulator [Microbacterium binotii]
MASTDDAPSRRGRSAKPPLSRQAILDAAKHLVRAHGVDALTLRQVADRVETGPASLYAYFANRDVLLEHLLDAAYSEVDLVEMVDDGWKHALAATIGNTIDALGRYPGLGAVALGTIPTLPGALRLAEHELALMEAGGVPGDRAALAVDLIAQFAASTAVERAVRPEDAGGAAQRGRVRAAYQEADPERFPRVTRSAALLTGPGEEARRAFAINLIVNGIERSE